MRLTKLLILICFLFTTAFAKNEATSSPRYLIEINISACKLWLYELEMDGSHRLVHEYVVATAQKGLASIPLGRGTVTGIKFNPTWYPTDYSREYFAKRGINLPRVVPPGDPLNFLGVVYISLSHTTAEGAIYGIHGNNDESLIGQRVTGGCIRMHNKEAIELAKIITIGTKVNIVP